MSSSAFPFLDGRTAVDGTILRAPGRRGARRDGVLVQVRRRLRRTPPAAAPDGHVRRDLTDEYLDRTGLSSVDWSDALARQALR